MEIKIEDEEIITAEIIPINLKGGRTIIIQKEITGANTPYIQKIYEMKKNQTFKK